MGTCGKCGGKDGAHYLGCVLERLFERILGPGYPVFAPRASVDPGETEQRVQDFVDTLERGDVATIPLPTLKQRAPVKPVVHGATTKQVPAEIPRPGGRGSRRLTDEAQAGVELFVQEHLVDGDPADYARADDLRDLYEQWRHTIDAPALDPTQFGMGLVRAGLNHKRQATKAEAGQRPRSTVYLGHRIKGAETPTPSANRVGYLRRAAKDLHEAGLLVKQFAEDCLILGENGWNGTAFAQREDWIPGHALTEAYNEWAQTQGAAELVQRDVSMGMRPLGYTPRQVHKINNSKPMLFYGVILRNKINWGQPRVSETMAVADDKESHTLS